MIPMLLTKPADKLFWTLSCTFCSTSCSSERQTDQHPRYGCAELAVLPPNNINHFPDLAVHCSGQLEVDYSLITGKTFDLLLLAG